MKRSSPLKRRSPLRAGPRTWHREVSLLPDEVKSGPLPKSSLKRKKPLRARRNKPRRDGQWRSREYLDRIKALGYCSAAAILGVTGCWSIIDPDHLGKKPGKGIKCSDAETAPMCRRCHSWREDRQGVFKGYDDVRMADFCAKAMILAEWNLNYESFAGHGRRRAS